MNSQSDTLYRVSRTAADQRVVLEEFDRILSEAANSYTGSNVNEYYLHGIWKARALLKVYAATLPQETPAIWKPDSVRIDTLNRLGHADNMPYYYNGHWTIWLGTPTEEVYFDSLREAIDAAAPSPERNEEK